MNRFEQADTPNLITQPIYCSLGEVTFTITILRIYYTKKVMLLSNQHRYKVSLFKGTGSTKVEMLPKIMGGR